MHSQESKDMLVEINRLERTQNIYCTTDYTKKLS